MRRVVAVRMVVAFFAVALLFATVGALAWFSFVLGETAPPAGATVDVTVVGRDGTERFNGTVLAAPATALGALEAAGREAGFEVRAVEYPNGRYVAAVGDDAAEGVAGWVYRVGRGADATYPPVASDRYALADGDRVVWHWTDEPISRYAT